REGAQVARAKVALTRWDIIDETAGVRTDDVERLDGFAFFTPQIDGADGGGRGLRPGIDAAGDDGEFAGHAVFGERAEMGDTDGRAAGELASEGIEDDEQARHQRDEADEAADENGGGPRKKAPSVGRGRMICCCHI